VIPPGPTARRRAERARTKLLSQVDEKRNPKTKATVDYLIDAYLETLDVEVSTMRGYKQKINKHIRPLLGRLVAGRVGVKELESFYGVLRRCRDHCDGKKYIVHRKAAEHTCMAVCKPHVCKGLADSSIRQIHWIISGFLGAGVR
jgi:integrase